MTRVRIAVVVALGALAGASAPDFLAAQAPTPAALDGAARTITEADYMRRIGVIAHDSMQGRDTPSPGLEKTAAWLASEMRGLGLRGGAPDGAFLQRYPIRSLVVDRAASGLSGGTRTLAYGTDVLPMIYADGGGEATAGLVVVSGTRDLPRTVSENPVRAQHAVLVLPAGALGLDQETLGYARVLRNAGAASVLVTTGADDGTWATMTSRAFGPSVAKGWESTRASPPFRPILAVRTAAIAELLRARSIDLTALQARAGQVARVDRVQGLTLTLAQRMRDEQVTAPNVVAILDGSDPTLRNEYVVFSAHMDHVGIGAPDQRGDSIFNGADDDASGTTAVVEIAEAMASLATKPRRSLIFLWVSGEEKGLWGSEYFSEHPSVPASQLVADLNMDMVGRNWTDTIVAIGKEHSNLGTTLERVNAAHPELRMTAIDDLWPEESFYTRSDHYNFAVKGVPILFFFNGTHEDYHGRDDEVDRIDGEKASRIARLVFYLGAEIANADPRPVWNPDSYGRIVTGR